LLRINSASYFDHFAPSVLSLEELVIHNICRSSVRRLFTLCILFFAAVPQLAHAQQAGVTLSGTVTDAVGGVLQNATISVKNEATSTAKSVEVDPQGHFSLSDLVPGRYSVEVSAPGFSASRRAVQLNAGQNMEITVPLNVGDVSQQVTVEANAVGSVAAALAPMDALLDATSARTIITPAFIQNFTSPIADFGEIVNMAPNTFTTSSDGVGLGQSKTIFRGFPDGDYDIDFDGIPFYDTNTPSHHSWAFFPAQSIGGVDFDRSPGTASTIGPTPFGGSIHLLSRDLDPLQNVRATFATGSFNTYLYDAQYDSGSFGPSHKLNLTADVHHMQSRGYQTLNIQAQNAGSLKMQYKVSDKTTIAGYSGVVWADANTPNFSATRCQMYGVGSGYSCFITGTTLYPLTGAGINFLLTNNSDPLLYLNTQYNWYHVPTDFEYVTVQSQFGHGFSFEFKPYTYNYDNSEKYSNATTMTELPASAFPATPTSPAGTYLGLPVAPCNTIVTKKGVSALPCAVDKYNSYRKYGEVSRISQVSKFGIFNAGMWYEWANTNRHQYPTDPLNGWTDQLLPNFAEKFVTNSYQPFAEFQWHITSRLNFTPGVKFAYYTVGTQQFADNGKTIGCLVPGSCNPSQNPAINPKAFVANGGSYFSTLPSGSINYRIKNNWSAYVQAAQGSIVPPSSVFDFNQGTTGNVIPPAVLPKQQKNTTYQTGTVLKLKYFTFDADYFHVHFDNSYSSVLDPSGEPVYFLQPSSVTQGVEVEANATFGHGLGVYFNGSYDHAVYSGALNVSCNSGAGCASTTPQLAVTAPSGLWVQQTPSNIETFGATYQHRTWDAAFFDKSIGQQFIDNGAYHNQFTVPRFNMANAFINYTIRSGGRFDQTKLRLSLNNIFNSSSVTGITLAGSPLTQNITANGTTYTNPFNTSAPTPINGQDNVSILAGRSIMLSVTFGLAPKR
jgi:iron complex outermembrane receptor protein